MKHTRITIDIDSKNFLFKYLKLYWLRKCFNCIVIKPSSKKGFHIIAWLKKSVSTRTHFELRKFLGDDKIRIKLDKQRAKRGEPINILFEKKYDFFYVKK